jgi:hypothetical protein
MTAAPDVWVRANPIQGFAPLGVNVTYSVTRDPRNVRACLVIDGPNYSSSTCFDPNDRPQTQWQQHRLPVGRNTIAIAVMRQDGSIKSAHTSVCAINESAEKDCGDEL